MYLSISFIYRKIVCHLVWISMMSMHAQGLHAIKAIANAKPDSITLRWAPSDKETWKLGNQYGYKVTRYTLVANNKLLHTPIKEMLTSEPLKPLALPDWEPIVKDNAFSAIAAQALHGTDFKVNTSASMGPSWHQVYQKSNEQDMRFSFALFAADMEKAVAQASGLYWVDKKIKKDHKYLYKIYVCLPDRAANIEFSIDTALVYIGTDAYTPLPKPAEFRVDFMDSTALLSWNREIQQSVYVAYQIERSNDGGKTFHVRNHQPFIPILKDFKNPFAFYIDSTTANVEHQYRILGINAFGEKGPYTNIVKGSSRPSVQLAPQYPKYELQDNSAVKILWQFEAGQLSKIQGFKVYRSSEHEFGYKLLNTNSLILKSQYYFIDTRPLSAGYYKVVAMDVLGKEHTSFPIMVQFEDREPPQAPIAFTGTIDRQGLVRLAWTPNTEDDLLGYYVYGSNGRHEEYARLNPSCLKTPTFATYIELKTLTDSIYYEVLALDKHYNESFRTRIALARPDIVPPAPVGIVSTIGYVEGIKLLWYNSPSKDVNQYLITRMEEGCKDCEKMVKVVHNGDSTFFIDSSTIVGKTYQYSIQAEDNSGLRSETMETLKVQRKRIQPKAKIHAFEGVWDQQHRKIKLEWKASGNIVKHWIIYRASQGERLQQYASAQELTYVDIEIEPHKIYEYYLRPVFMDRTLGSMSKVLYVKTESK